MTELKYLLLQNHCMGKFQSNLIGTKHPWVKGTQVCSNERSRPFPRGNEKERAKIHWRNLKNWHRVQYSTLKMTRGSIFNRVKIPRYTGPDPRTYLQVWLLNFQVIPILPIFATLWPTDIKTYRSNVVWPGYCYILNAIEIL